MKPEDIFECKMCGQCCQGYGGTYVTQSDIQAIAKHIGADPKTFVDKYCRISGDRPVLAQKSDGYCVFFNGQCAIHEVKPKMCRQWPYLPAVLRDKLNWQIMADSCPGCKGEVPYAQVARVIQDVLKNRELA